ncbi:hypothetical protein HWC59_gp15 [Proteus phage Myduc]|uniref:Uncharacterized protein n=1 Tax=Proteus phage Myduc TaxID=2650874 RepID=A0A5J6T7I0_9CAUD|nr:hypothetical protein HWC59_gp15 [Proteus phage Myduc]QFG06638.1 hypothetical protein CPT_Myduc_015 [Proteus phage Myduc]
MSLSSEEINNTRLRQRLALDKTLDYYISTQRIANGDSVHCSDGQICKIKGVRYARLLNKEDKCWSIWTKVDVEVETEQPSPQYAVLNCGSIYPSSTLTGAKQMATHRRADYIGIIDEKGNFIVTHYKNQRYIDSKWERVKNVG